MVLGALHNSDTEKPPAGASGIHHDRENKVIHAYYGTNDMHDHMVHLLENHQQYPENKRQYSVPKNPSTYNREHAMQLSGLEVAAGHVRDEKPPNLVKHDGKTVTVKHVPEAESRKYFPE